MAKKKLYEDNDNEPENQPTSDPNDTDKDDDTDTDESADKDANVPQTARARHEEARRKRKGDGTDPNDASSIDPGGYGPAGSGAIGRSSGGGGNNLDGADGGKSTDERDFPGRTRIRENGSVIASLPLADPASEGEGVSAEKRAKLGVRLDQFTPEDAIKVDAHAERVYKYNLNQKELGLPLALTKAEQDAID